MPSPLPPSLGVGRVGVVGVLELVAFLTPPPSRPPSLAVSDHCSCNMSFMAHNAVRGERGGTGGDRGGQWGTGGNRGRKGGTGEGKNRSGEGIGEEGGQTGKGGDRGVESGEESWRRKRST